MARVASQPSFLRAPSFIFCNQSLRGFNQVKLSQELCSRQHFHSTNSPKPVIGSIDFRHEKCALGAKQLENFGIATEEAVDEIPLIFHKIRKAIRTEPELNTDQQYWQTVKESFASFQKEGNESTFPSHAVRFLRYDLDRLQAVNVNQAFVQDARWIRVKPLDPSIQPRLSVPKSDVLIGLHGKALGRCPLTSQRLGSLMYPTGHKTDQSLAFPFAAIEFKNQIQDARTALRQNLRTAAFMLRNQYELMLVAEPEFKIRTTGCLQDLIVLTIIITPSEASLYAHWIAQGQGGKLRFAHRRVNREVWRFPCDVEIASNTMIKASNWIRENTRSRIMACLERSEAHLIDLQDTSQVISVKPGTTVASPVHGFFTSIGITPGGDPTKT